MPGGIDDGVDHFDEVGTQISHKQRDDDAVSAVSSRMSGDYSLSTPPMEPVKRFSPPPQSTVSSVTAVSSNTRGKGKKSKKR